MALDLPLKFRRQSRLCREPDSKTEWRPGRSKTILLFSLACPAVQPCISKRSYLSSTPRNTTGSHQTAGGVPAPRESHPRVVLTQPPPLPATDHGNRRFNARTLGWTGVSLTPLPVIAMPGAARHL